MTEQTKTASDTFFQRLGRWMAEWLNRPTTGYEPYTASDITKLRRTLQPGDVLLVEGNQRVSSAIKYLTQSTFSHAALYVGDALKDTDYDQGDGNEPDFELPTLVEVNVGQGCVASRLSKYNRFNTRICRPVGLTHEDRNQVVSFMVSKIGLKYDLKNIFDLLRYFLPTPPVPVRWRRRMLAFGSGDPTRAICSSLIAQAFQQVGYPILPEITLAPGRPAATSDYSRSEILHIRHHSLFAPRDFDISPYFRIVKPTIEFGFDYKAITWGVPANKLGIESQISDSKAD